MEECFFDATTVDPLNSGFAPLPEGEYEVMIVKSQNKPTKSGTGSYLELQSQVISGDYKGRVLWTRLNLRNPNAAAVEMARRELSSICHALNVLRPRTKEELHNIPLIARVALRDDGRGGQTNEIKGWKACSQQSATPPPSAPAQAQAQAQSPAQPTSAGARPW